MNKDTDQIAEKDAHSLQRDDRGWFCLDCSWPGSNFTYRRQDALAHKAESVLLPGPSAR